jgi:hypothetical protein
MLIYQTLSLSGMNARAVLSIVILFCAVLAIAGCTSTPTVAPAATQAPVASAAPPGTVVAASSGASLVPSPTDVVIASRALNLNIEKDYLGNVIVTFQGGSGNGHVKSFDVTVNRADGQVSNGNLGVNIGDVLKLAGTKDTDRVIVVASMDDGKTYKVRDELSKFRTIG